MSSSGNFSFLAEHSPLLADLGATAERLFPFDPASCVLKLRLLAEAITQDIAARIGITLIQPSQAELLRAVDVRLGMDAQVRQLFHLLRRTGNLAAHEANYQDDNRIGYREGLQALKVARQIAVWFYRSFGRNPDFKPGPFQLPDDPSQKLLALQQQIAGLSTRLQAAEAAQTAQTTGQTTDQTTAQTNPPGQPGRNGPLARCPGRTRARDVTPRTGGSGHLPRAGRRSRGPRRHPPGPVRFEARRSKPGGNQPNLNLSKIKAFSLKLPNVKEQTEIVRRVEALFAFADRLEARLAQAQTAVDRLTPSLLAKAFRGELVPQDPADEPAAELLKRLAASRTAEAPKTRRGRQGQPA